MKTLFFICTLLAANAWAYGDYYTNNGTHIRSWGSAPNQSQTTCRQNSDGTTTCTTF